MERRRSPKLWITLVALLVPSVGNAGSLGIEAGLALAYRVPMLNDSDPHAYTGLGLSGMATYDFGRVALGIQARSILTTKGSIHVTAGPYRIDGDLARRQTNLGAVFRYHFSAPRAENKRAGTYYAEVGIASVQFDLIDSQQVFDLASVPGDERVFVRGYGAWVGFGRQFKNSPFFVEINYGFEKYDWLQIVGIDKKINYVIEEPSINEAFVVHSFVLMIGLSDIF